MTAPNLSAAPPRKAGVQFSSLMGNTMESKMASNLTNTAKADTAIPSLETLSRSCVPRWVDISWLDSIRDNWGPQSPVPADAAPALFSAAEQIQAAMKPAGGTVTRNILRDLRLSTRKTNESPEEARASFEKLVASLQSLPAIALKEGCEAYEQSTDPDTRFFPRGAGEVNRFAEPIAQRMLLRAHRLRQTAKQAGKEPERPCTADEAAAIMKEFGLGKPLREKPAERKLKQPTREDYLAMGVPESDLPPSMKTAA